MYGHKKLAVGINDALQDFQNKALAVNNNPEYMQVIKGYLQFDLSRSTNEQDVLLNSLNSLSFMEVQVEMTKQMALLQLIQKQPPLPLLVKEGKMSFIEHIELSSSPLPCYAKATRRRVWEVRSSQYTINLKY